jgi:quercetin dioxygenase-like cupin family protein
MAEKNAVRTPEESQAIWFLGGLYEVRVSSDETADAITVMEFTIPDGAGPPPHIHNCHEVVYILDGKARYHIGDETTEVGPGTVVDLPEGTIETFEPIGQLRMLIVYTPGGIDRFFREVGEPAKEHRVPDPLTEAPDFAHLTEVAARHGLQLLGPPPGQ